MKRARLELTWDELLLVRNGLDNQHAYTTQQLEQHEDDRRYPAIRAHYARQLADIEALLPRVEKAIGRT